MPPGVDIGTARYGEAVRNDRHSYAYALNVEITG
jgi:hypothetical protein